MSTMATGGFQLSSLLSSFVPTTDISYYTVPAAWILAVFPHYYAIIRYTNLNKAASSSSKEKDNREFNKTSPRTFLDTINGNPHISQEHKDMLVRAEGAHFNGIENLGWFAAGVVAANSAGVDVWWCNALSLAYLANRVLFIWVYIRGARGPVRGAPFYGSIA